MKIGIVMIYLLNGLSGKSPLTIKKSIAENIDSLEIKQPAFVKNIRSLITC